MPGSGVSAYEATSARGRPMYSMLLSQQDFARLEESPHFTSLIEQLKHTAYGPYLENVKDRDFTPRQALLSLKSRLADAYSSVIQTVPGDARSLLKQLYRHFEVDNLKAILRGIETGQSWEPGVSLWERVRYVLFPFGPTTVLPAQ